MPSDRSPPFRIFLNYRREDEDQYVAGRLHFQLGSVFGKDNVFMDVDANIPEGVDFEAFIKEAVARANVLLAIVGRHWITDESGRRRLDDERDFLRIELETALRGDIPVIPVFVESAESPTASDLPESLERLAKLQGRKLRHDSWDHDSGRLIHRLKQIESERLPTPPPPTTPTSTPAPPPPPRRSLLSRFSRNRILILGGVTGAALLSAVAALVMTNGGSDDRTTTQGGQTTTQGGQTTTTELLLEDTFSSDAYDWVAQGQVGGRYSNGAYLIQAEAIPLDESDQMGVIALPANASRAENVRIDIEAVRTGGSAGSSGYGYGIVCRAADDLDDLYRFTFWPAGPAVHIQKRVDGQWEPIKEKELSSAGMATELQAECVTKPGGVVELNFVVNGMRIHASDDEEPLGTGAYGLTALLGPRTEPGETLEVQFDYIAVSEIQARKR